MKSPQLFGLLTIIFCLSFLAGCADSPDEDLPKFDDRTQFTVYYHYDFDYGSKGTKNLLTDDIPPSSTMGNTLRFVDTLTAACAMAGFRASLPLDDAFLSLSHPEQMMQYRKYGDDSIVVWVPPNKEGVWQAILYRNHGAVATVMMKRAYLPNKELAPLDSFLVRLFTVLRSAYKKDELVKEES